MLLILQREECYEKITDPVAGADRAGVWTAAVRLQGRPCGQGVAYPGLYQKHRLPWRRTAGDCLRNRDCGVPLWRRFH